jgi:hypothetical protein
MSVLLNQILDIGEEESIFLAEESLQDLLDLPVTRGILAEGLAANACIIIRDLGLALRLEEPEGCWLLLTDRYSADKILQPESQKWLENELGKGRAAKTVTANNDDFFRGLAEYFAASMAGELFCESCLQSGRPFYVEERIERLRALLEPMIDPSEDVLEICCGSGMATQALLRLGCRPTSMDLDRCELCLALKSGLMEAQNSFVLDARLLPLIFPPRSFHAVVGFMVGLIDDFNWPLWKEILLKASGLAEKSVLFTVYTQKEAELIAKAMAEAGWKEEVIDNRDKSGIYDQWAIRAARDA